MGNLPKAEEFYLKSLKIRQNLFGENHSNVATSYNNLGSLYDNMGNLPKAEEFYLKSLKIRQNLFGENHSNVATSYNNLGGLHYNMGNLPKAEEFYLKSLKIYENLFGENHLNVAQSYYNLSVFYSQSIKKPYVSLNYAKKSYEIILGLLGKSHPKTIQYFKNYNNILVSLNQLG